MIEPDFGLDQIGPWSEVKLDIVREYASAYSRILSARTNPSLYHIYVNAFAGAGVHLSRTSGKFVQGSPLNALNIEPPFREYHFIDLDSSKVAALRSHVGKRPDVYIYEGDCNEILLQEILPRCRYKQYRRALWLLDPYGLHIDWRMLAGAGQEESVDVFLNFPIMDINRNVLLRDQSKVRENDRARMDAFWGNDSWREVAYSNSGDLFGWKDKARNEVIIAAFCSRLREIGGFAHVLEPMPMRNTKGAVVYYLNFASQKPVAQNIVKSIFRKYENRMPN